MQKRATLKVFDGMRPIQVTGNVVRIYDNGSVTIDDERGVRHFATADRAQFDTSHQMMTGNGLLW